MWNCKLCVGKIGPWTVVAVDHASWRKRWNPPHPIIPTHREGWSLRIRKEGRPVGEKREGFVVDLNARSSDRATFWGGGGWHTASKELEICYVMSNDHSPANMKKDFFFGSRRGRGGWRFLSWQWKVGKGWSAVSQWKRKLEEGGDGEHGARNIKRGMKETAVTYATRKSSSEKLHPSMPLELGPPLHFNDDTGISRQRYVSMSRESEEIPLSFFFFFCILSTRSTFEMI